MTGTAGLRSALAGLLSFAAAEEQALLAAAAFGLDFDRGSPDRWAAVPVVAHDNQFKGQQAERLWCVLSGRVPPAYDEIDHACAAVYQGYLAQPPKPSRRTPTCGPTPAATPTCGSCGKLLPKDGPAGSLGVDRHPSEGALCSTPSASPWPTCRAR